MPTNTDPLLKAEVESRGPGPSLRKMERRSRRWQNRPFDRHLWGGIDHTATSTAYKKGRKAWKLEQRKKRIAERKKHADLGRR